MGIFAIVLVLLLLGVVLYWLLNYVSKRYKFFSTIKSFLHRKLFYNGFLRYMIVSNLKLTVLVWAFFFSTYTSESEWALYIRFGFIIAIIFLLVYPIFLAAFLIKNQYRLEEPYFIKRFNTAFDGIEIEYK